MSSNRLLRVAAATSALIACTGTGPAAGVNAVVPYQPSGLVAVAGDGLVAVSWLVPVQSQSATERNVILQYTVTSSPGGVIAHCAGDVFGATVTGLTNGVTYTFTVYATNEAGNSEVSAPSNPATPSSVPGAPTNVLAVGAGEGTATVTWTPPTQTGGSQIIAYNVTATPMGVAAGQVFTVGGTMTTVQIPELNDAISYTFTVAAENDIGIGPPSETSASVTTVFPPGPVTDIILSARNGDTVVIFWTPPADNGGSFISGYRMTPYIGTTAQPYVDIDGATPSYTFTLADMTTYTFEVQAQNLATSTGGPPAFSGSVTTCATCN